MKNFFVFFIFLSSCKSPQATVADVQEETKMVDCPLTLLPKTENYEKEIENYASIYQDTIIDIESAKNGLYGYKTLLELKASERYLWLLKTKGSNVDSLLIQSIAQNKSIDSEFDMDHCSIEIQTTKFDENGNPIVSSARSIDF